MPAPHVRVPCQCPLLNFSFFLGFWKIWAKKTETNFSVVQNGISKYKKALYKADDNHATYICGVKTWNSWVPRYSIFIYTLSFDVILWNILSWRIPRRIPWRCCWISATTDQFCQQFTAGNTASNWHNQDIQHCTVSSPVTRLGQIITISYGSWVGMKLILRLR